MHVRGPTTYPVQVIESEFKQNQGRPTPFNDPSPGYETRYDVFGGGAIQNSGNLYLARTLIDGNFTELNKGGGGLSNEAASTATLEECVFTKNKATAKGSGDNNNAIDFAWGGAIYNAGELNLVRCSIHGNEADFAGAIMNHKPGKLNIYNSTITNNTAKNQHGGLVNEHPSFDPNSGGAEIRLVHTTIGKNNAGSADPLGNLLYASDFKSIWFTNSIIDTACNQIHYSLGHSVFTGPCVTEPDPNIDPNLESSGDITNTTQTQLGLQSLSSGSSSVPNFKVQKIDGGSIATDIGRDDAWGCSHPKINRKDQNQDARGAGGTLCDAGAIEAGSLPPQFSSNPGPGLIEFPIVNLAQGQSESKIDLTLFNLGGGVMSFLVMDEGGSSAILNESQSQGFLFKNQETKLTFKCAPPSVGDFWRTVSIETSAPNKKKANYKFRCTGAGNGPQGSLNQQPGPLNMPATAPGQASHTTINMTNRGKQPLTANYGWTDNNSMWASNGTKLPPAQAQSAQAEPNAPQTEITLNPGETCKWMQPAPRRAPAYSSTRLCCKRTTQPFRQSNTTWPARAR
ncbi:MAG: hypothetical protein HC853_05075 [Anaerolineae bacterium]|nr:hypothetical protein [Anaerolineae bacterium]